MPLALRCLTTSPRLAIPAPRRPLLPHITTKTTPQPCHPWAQGILFLRSIRSTSWGKLRCRSSVLPSALNRLRPGVQLIDGSKVRLMKQLTQLNQILTLIWWRDPAAFKALPNDPAIGPRSSPLSHVATGGRPCATRSKAARSPGRTRPRTGQTPWDRRCTAPAVATSPAGARVLQPAACTSSQIHRIMVSSEL